MSFFGISSMVQTGAQLTSMLVVLRWIPPGQMGVWQTLLLAQSYLGILKLGVPNAMNRELPFLLGAGEESRAHRVAQLAHMHALTIAALALLLFVVGIVSVWDQGWEWRIAVPAMAAVSAANLYRSYIQGTYRSLQDFTRLGWIQIGEAGFTLLLPVFAFWGGFAGLCFHQAANALLAVGISFRFRPIRARPRWNGGVARELLPVAIPLLATNYGVVLGRGMEKLVLLLKADVEAVGLFAPAIAVMNAMQVLPQAISGYAYPRMSFSHGRSDGRGSIWSQARQVLIASLVFSAPMAVAGWILLPPLVTALVPDYSQSIPAMRLALLAGAVLSTTATTAVLRALKAWPLLFLFVAIFALSRGGFAWLAFTEAAPATSVAEGSVIAALVIAVAAYCISRRAVNRMEHGREDERHG